MRNPLTKKLACQDCGASIFATTNNRKRCYDCAQKERLRQQARYRANAKDRVADGESSHGQE